jgi:DNA adenine methylase
MPMHIGSQPRPFLRWAGGKGRLAEALLSSIPNSFFSTSNNYFEPFLGGGALMFALGNSKSKKYLPGKRIVINDSNPELVCTYIVVRDDIEALIRKLHLLSDDTSKSAFLKIRSSKPSSELGRAARFIYLNKTCFNGLWRVNNNGDFNVPWAGLKSPKILDEVNLRIASTRLKGSTISVGNYQESLKFVSKGDLVYLDPPYLPLSTTSNFSKYAKEDFGPLDHYSLAGVIDGLTSQGVRVILSNSDTTLTRRIFGESLYLHKVSVQRMIPARSSSRLRVNEIIGTNFRISKHCELSRLQVI